MALRMGPSRRNAEQATADSRVSWGAIFAGAACALALQVIFSLITAGFGLEMVDDGDMSGAGWASGLFLCLTAIASLFAGGAVAGRLSGQPFLPSAVIHGAVVWAIVLLGAVWLTVSATGALVGGAARTAGAAGDVAGRAISTGGEALGDAVAAVAPDMDELSLPDMETLVPESIERDLRELLGEGDLTAAEVRDEARALAGAVVDDNDIARARAIVSSAARRMIRSPGEADEIFETAVDRLTAPDGPLGEGQIDELRDVLQSRYGISPEQTEEIVARWRSEFVAARDAAVETWRETWTTVSTELDDAAETAAELAREAADSASAASWWAAFAGLLGLAAAGIGAAVSRPEDIVWEAPASRPV